MQERIYFDHNATTKVAADVLGAMNVVYNQPLNPSAVHYYGRSANQLADMSRQYIKNLIGANNYQLIFTSGGTEANNLAIFGLSGYQLISSEIEHSSVYNIALKQNSILIKTNKDGIVDTKYLQQILNNLHTDKFVVSVMLANNETGAIQPLKQISAMVHEKGGLVHSDIIQAVGKINIDLSDLDIDLASVSAHKINGPQGVGALLVKENIDVMPMIYGGGQEGGKRSGTHNVAGIVGFGKACKIAGERMSIYKKISTLRDYLENSIRQVAGGDAVIFSNKAVRLPNTSLIATKGLDNQIQLINFDLNNILVSIGAACSSGSPKPSRVLKAMGFEDSIIKNTIRISLGLENTKEQVDKFVGLWEKMYNKLKLKNKNG